MLSDNNPILVQIKQAINNRIQKIAFDLTNGGAGSFEDYKTQCGIVKGLKAALYDIDDVVEQYMSGDDDE